MILVDEFEIIVRKYFDYLIDDFGFSYKGITSQPYTYHVLYIKDNRLVRIDLAYRHDFIDINIFNKVNEVLPTTQNFDYSVNLASLIYKEKPRLEFGKEYESMMPHAIGLEKSVETLSQLFKKYADSILRFKTWISRNDCK